MSIFEKNVRKALIDRELTLSAFAKELGICVSYLHEILKSTRKSEKQRARICEYLELDM